MRNRHTVLGLAVVLALAASADPAELCAQGQAPTYRVILYLAEQNVPQQVQIQRLDEVWSAEDRFGWQHANPYLSIVIGVGLIMLLSFFGHALGVAGGPLKVFGAVLTVLGFIAQYVAWTIGLGVLLLTRFGTRYRWGDGETPEPVPAPPPPVTATHADPGAPPAPPTL